MNHENIKVRNEQILNDYVAGMSVEAISEKYQLSSYHCYSIGPDGKKIPYRVERGTIWRLVWCGGEQSFKEFTGPDKMRITLPDEYVEKYFKKV